MKTRTIIYIFILIFVCNLSPRLSFARQIDGTTQEFHAHKIIQTLSYSYYKRFQKQVAFYNMVFPSNQDLAKYR